MQDLIFYVAANETLGAVRDYANIRNESAPTLVLGVSVCLRMRLFTERNVATAYPISAFSGITTWNWSMDGDYDRSTTCKLTADAGSIEVQSVTDTVNGESMTFTEFVIPISAMNTEELAQWLGTAESKSGLTGELVGYDGTGSAVFVLQIENFTVRNRIAGIGDPTSQDQELLTRSEAQSMIQYAISGATINVNGVVSAVSAGYASSAGVAASLTSAAKTAILSSAAANAVSVATSSSYGTVMILGSVTSTMSGTSVVVPTVNAMIDYVSSHGGSGGGGSGGTSTVVISGGTADYASSAGGLVAAAKSDIVTSAQKAAYILTPTSSGVNAANGYVTANSTYATLSGFGFTPGGVMVLDTIDSVLGSGVNEFAVPNGDAVIDYVSSHGYDGPFHVGVSGGNVVVDGGRMYLGGAEYAVASSTLTSSNGTVYYYVYYSGGSYYSGCSIAASASALASAIRGSAGYYTALATVSGGVVKQCHYGDIRIDGRVV